MPDHLFQADTVVILDFETTGLSAINDRVIEVAAVRYRNSLPEETFTTLINPGVRPSPRIVEITGIDAGMLHSAPAPEYVFPRLVRFLGDHPILAHNASFDQRFFEAEANRTGIRWQARPFHCTLKLARKAWPRFSSHRLGDLARELKLPVEGNLHRAEADVRLTGHLFAAIREALAASQRSRTATPKPKASATKPAVDSAKSSSARSPERPAPIRPAPVRSTLADKAASGDVQAAITLARMALEGKDIGEVLFRLPTWLEAGIAKGSHEAARLRGELARAGCLPGEGLATALQYLEIAARLGSPEAAFALGSLFHEGEGMHRSMTKAIAWYERGAKAGSPSAAFNLGVIYAHAHGVAANGQLASRWYETAFKLGEPDAAFNLALLYEQGALIPKDLDQAILWFGKAAEAGHPEADAHRQFLQEQTNVEPPTPQKGPKVEPLIQKPAPHPRHLEQAALGKGEKHAAFAIAYGYDVGTWGVADRAQAIHWYNIAAGLGSEGAMRILALMESRS